MSGFRLWLACLGVAWLLLPCACRKPAIGRANVPTAPTEPAPRRGAAAVAATPALYATPMEPAAHGNDVEQPRDNPTLRFNVKSLASTVETPPEVPPEAMLDPTFDFTGEWNDLGGCGGEHLSIFRQSDNDYDVTYSISFGAGWHDHKGNGHLANGILRLDLPDDAILAPTTLYALQAGGLPVLAAPDRVQEMLDFATLCDAAQVSLKDNLMMRPGRTFIRRIDYK